MVPGGRGTACGMELVKRLLRYVLFMGIVLACGSELKRV
jgi:hypothetical protein